MHKVINRFISTTILIGLFSIYSFAYALYSAGSLVSMTNNERSQNGLSTLTVNQALINAANAKANDMFADGYFAHTSPDGKTPWDFIHEAGYNYTYAGENLAIGYSDASELMNDWMNSPSHRENILNPNFKEIGIAVVSGTYNGTSTVIVVQEFGATSSQVQASQTANSSSGQTINFNLEKSSINPPNIFAGEEVEFRVTYSGTVKSLELAVGDKKFDVLKGQKIATSGSENTYSLKEKIDQVGTFDVIVTGYDSQGNQKSASLGKLEVKATVIAKSTENKSLFAGFRSTGPIVGMIVLAGGLITVIAYLVIKKTKLQKSIKVGSSVWEF